MQEVARAAENVYVCIDVVVNDAGYGALEELG